MYYTRGLGHVRSPAIKLGNVHAVRMHRACTFPPVWWGNVHALKIFRMYVPPMKKKKPCTFPLVSMYVP